MAETPTFFNRIARHYDWFSTVLSAAGILAWRRAALKCLALSPGHEVLDVGCGTGAVTAKMARMVGSTGRIVGLDPSEGMLRVARGRKMSPQNARVGWVFGVGEALEFANASFDRVTAHFSLRNASNWRMMLAEMTRVTRPGGRLEILDLVQPATTMGAWAMRGLEMATRLLEPRRFDPYRWLGRSLWHAPSAAELQQTLETLGWEVNVHRRWLGDLVVLMVTSPKRVPSENHRPVMSAKAPVRIVWATDGSAVADAGGDWLLSNGPEQATIDVVTVCPPLSAHDRVALEGTDQRAWRTALDNAKQRIAHRYPVQTHLLQGEPAAALLDYGRRTRPSLMIVGMKHRDPGADRLFGSVALHLMAHANWPVLAVPLEASPAKTERDGESGVTVLHFCETR